MRAASLLLIVNIWIFLAAARNVAPRAPGKRYVTGVGWGLLGWALETPRPSGLPKTYTLTLSGGRLDLVVAQHGTSHPAVESELDGPPGKGEGEGEGGGGGGV